MKLDVSHYWEMTAVCGMNHPGCYLTGANHLLVLVQMKWRASQGSEWFVSFKRGNICLNLVPLTHRGCWGWSPQWGWGSLWVPPPQTHAHKAIFIPHPFHSILPVQISAHGTEGRKGRLQVWQSCWDSEWSERCIRIWGFSLIYHSPPHYICSG